MTEQMNLIHTKCAVNKVEDWHSIDWKKVQRNVRKLQVRIMKAEQAGKTGKVKALQRLLSSSFSAKALAVRQVTENRGKKTAGIDGKTWSNPKEKWEAIFSLKRKGYHPKPLKRIYIPKGQGKVRPLSIPVMKDRAMQALHLFTLLPLAEYKADNNSYGFRPYRSCADAIQHCFQILRHKNSAKWILEGDIKGCFDTISHQWLMQNIPMDKVILNKWLQTGYVEKNQLYLSHAGVPQGGIASPTIANLALDGLEKVIQGCTKSKDDKIYLVRYADDWIITAREKNILQKRVKPAIEQFLKQRGLFLSETKTKITHIDKGFDFLGQNIRKYGDKLLIKPSKKSIKHFLQKVKQILVTMKAVPTVDVVDRLNPLIRGWTNYHRHIVAKKTFSYIDARIWNMIWRWAVRRHSTKSRKWIAQKYFTSKGGRNWVFHGVDKNGKQKCLITAAEKPIRRHIKIKAKANPFDPSWEVYFEQRNDYVMKERFQGKLKKLYQQQNGKCLMCKQVITLSTGWNVHHSVEKHLGGSNNLENLQLLHPNCHRQLHHRKAKMFNRNKQ